MTARDIIAGAVDEAILGPSTRGSRFAAKKLAEHIERELALAGYRIVPPPAPPEPKRPGVYLNLETGLIRTFPYDKPRRGKWEFVKPLSRRALRESGG